MSLELQDLVRLSGEHRDFDKKYLVTAYSIPNEVKTKTFNLDSPISYVFVVGIFDHPEKALEDALECIIEYINRYPYLTFEIVKTHTLHGLGGKKKELNLKSEEWKSMNVDELKKISETREGPEKTSIPETPEKSKISNEIQQEKIQQLDENSLESFRYQFFNVCQNKEAIKLKRKDLTDLENKTLERINKCLKFIALNPGSLENLKQMYREKLDARGEGRIADYLISNLNDLDEKGLPKVLSPYL